MADFDRSKPHVKSVPLVTLTTAKPRSPLRYYTCFMAGHDVR